MAAFEPAIEVVLRHEGGYVNDPADQGGETKFGISRRAYPDVDIKNLTAAQAEEIYRRDYWQYDGIGDQTLATKLLDLSVLQGPSVAVTLLQQALHHGWGFSVVVDGKLGPATLTMVARVNPAELLHQLRAQAVVRLVGVVEGNEALRKYLLGWVLRAVE